MSKEEFGFGARVEHRNGSTGVAFDPVTIAKAYDEMYELMFRIIDGSGVGRETTLGSMLGGCIISELAAAFLAYPPTMMGKSPAEVFARTVVSALNRHGYDCHLEIAIEKREEEVPEQNAPSSGEVN